MGFPRGGRCPDALAHPHRDRDHHDGRAAPIYTSVERVLCKGILEFCGVQRTRWINFCEVSLVSPEQRRAWLDEVEAVARSLV